MQKLVSWRVQNWVVHVVQAEEGMLACLLWQRQRSQHRDKVAAMRGCASILHKQYVVRQMIVLSVYEPKVR